MEENKDTAVISAEETAQDAKKGKIAGAFKVAAAMGKKAVTGVQDGVKAMAQKAKNDGYAKRMKKYNPLFPDTFFGDSFALPNMIMIVDEAVRRDIDVCEGAIGWISKDTEIETLCLYDEIVEQSGLEFLPVASCDAVYYVDPFDKKRFIRTDCIFSRAHEEKLAELRHIAHFLGAKKCIIEICESVSEAKTAHKHVGSKQTVMGVKSGESYEASFMQAQTEERRGRSETVFEGSSTPRQPHLKWFLKDDNIKRLIEMRCGGDNSIKSEVLELSGTSSATMSQKTAIAIDSTLSKFESKTRSEMERQATKESRSKLIFKLEF